MTQISEIDKAWMAGIVDGEGSIVATQIRKPYRYYYVRCTIYNTNPLIIAEAVRVVEAIIGKRPTVSTVNRAKTHRPIYHVQIGNRKDTVRFLTAMLPYLRGKRHEAEIALSIAALCAARVHGNRWTGCMPIPEQVDVLLAELRSSRSGYVPVGNPEPSPAGVVSSGEGATVSPVSPNNNPDHERATSHLG